MSKCLTPCIRSAQEPLHSLHLIHLAANLLLAVHPGSVLMYSFKIHREKDNNLNTGLAVLMLELMHKKDRNHSWNTVYLLTCNEMSVRLAVPRIPWNTREFRLTAVAGCVREQKEGTTHRGRNTLQFFVASMFILIAGEQCYSTPPTAWACGLVAQSVPTHAIWLACFLLFFNIDFIMSNLTVSLPILE